jgi:ABC-2 type transport system permease protein
VAAHVLRLRIALLLGALRGDSAHVTRTVIGLVLLAGAAAAACWALLTLRDAPTDVVLAVIVLGGSAVTLGFALAPLIVGATDPLDPRRFVVLGLPSGRLAAVLFIVGFISVPIFTLLVVSICAAIVWGDHGVPWTAGAIGVVLGVATCVLLARVCMALTALFLRERRSRELSGLFALAILVVVVPVGVFFASLEWRGRVPSQLAEAVSALAITPLGAAWAFPGRVAQGGFAQAAPALLVAIATLVVLGLIWALLVRRLLTTTERPVSVRERGGLGWFAVAPGTPGGAVAARSLVYWLRDRRYIVNIIVIPIGAALTMVPLLIAGVPLEIVALVPVPIVALFLGWLPHNDLAYDSTAVWMHIASGLRGASDRIGRLVPVLLIGIPLLAVIIPLAIVVHGRWALLPAMVGVCAALFLSGLGLSSVSSVVAPYPVSRPGESPFQQPQRTGAGSAFAQAVVMLGAIAVSAPALWWGWLALNGDADAATMALWGGLAIGLIVLIGGIAIGSAVFERRGGRLMEFAESI